MRSNPDEVKEAVDQFALYARISPFSFLHRLLKQIDRGRKPSMSRKKKQNLAVLGISLWIYRLQERNERALWQAMRPRAVDSQRIWVKLALAINRKFWMKLMAEKF